MFSEPIKLIIFDMAGTTVYDDHYVTRALCEALLLHGYEVSQNAADAVMGIAKPVAIKLLLQEYFPNEIDDVRIATIHQDFLRLMKHFYQHSPDIREIDGTTEVFKSLQERGIKVGIDTGFSRDITDIIIERLGWAKENLIDVSVASDEVKEGRPAPDMVYKAMEMLSIPNANSVIKVGDTPVDILEGKNAGCSMVIGVLSGVGTALELGRFEDVIILDSLKDIPEILANKMPVVA